LSFAARSFIIRHMQTKVIKLGGAADEEAFREAGELIRRGELVAFPTETVYGLGGNGLDPAAAAKIYEAKGRPSDNPLILHIQNVEELAPLVKKIPPQAEMLMSRFWPGPLTIIFEKSQIVPKETSGGLNTVAVRMPSNRAARRLIREAGVPIAAPSANLSGRPSPTSAEHVRKDLDGRIPLILDGGEAQIGLESTIVDVSGALPEILRPGFIGEKKLRELLGIIKADAPASGDEKDAPPRAPGMKYRHYAPKAPLMLLKGSDKEIAAFLKQEAALARGQGESIGALVSREALPLYEQEDPGLFLFSLGSREDQEEIAHRLFALLRDLDDKNISRIYCESLKEEDLGQAIMNRLKKAAGFRIMDLHSTLSE